MKDRLHIVKSETFDISPSLIGALFNEKKSNLIKYIYKLNIYKLNRNHKLRNVRREKGG